MGSRAMPEVQDTPPQLFQADAEQYSFDNAMMLARASQIAYLKPPLMKEALAACGWSLDDGDYVEEPGLADDDRPLPWLTSTQLFIAWRKSEGTAILVFRGTE